MEQNPKQNPEQITLKIEQWVKNIQDYYHNKYEKDLLPEVSCTIEKKKKYVRMAKKLPDSEETALCFINIENGEILRPSSWKAPSKYKHGRGSIFKDYFPLFVK
ncbi:MAG: hypothetical protein O4808_11825 [Trichodesmium sp. St17_bin3_1_1]|nr:hypothetical protein [Trichodesmium sp. St17_bin3_1_1]